MSGKDQKRPVNDATLPPQTIDSWWRTQSATMALLKHAHGMIDAADKKIADQERRIQQLENLAGTDTLTELMNRRGFEKFFAHELERIRRHNSPGSLLVLIDLDHFKSINDTHGHIAGDACLKLVAEKIMKSIRILDGAARFGGDEFAILLTQTDPEKARDRVEKIRHTLNEMKLDWDGKKLHFGASLGSAIVSSKTDFMAAYDIADKDLYADKQRRREKR